ncbi:MAG: DapH/DapD/GlmU-related protein [Lachnospiraceae bacterium]|nr:DapH/DapD/GlmU-related protein [Lachnospiraceae bacterium]
MDIKKLRGLWDRLFEYDRAAERKIIKSIRLWNSNRLPKQVRSMFLYNRIRKKYGCSINPRIQLGENFYISHAQDIVIGQTSEIGDNCRVFPGAKLIAKVEGDEELVKRGVRRHPKIGNNCMLGADCIIIGPVAIGNNVTIAAGAIVTKDIPDNCTVIGTNVIREKSREM